MKKESKKGESWRKGYERGIKEEREKTIKEILEETKKIINKLPMDFAIDTEIMSRVIKRQYTSLEEIKDLLENKLK